MSCAASTKPKIWPLSSDGRNPFGIFANRNPVATTIARNTAIVARGRPITHLRLTSYACLIASKPRSTAMYSRPCFWACSGRRIRLHMRGESVSETKPEIRTAAMITTANSWSRRPRIPPMNRTGMNTAASESVIETMVNEISREPSRVACRGVLPISR